MRTVTISHLPPLEWTAITAYIILFLLKFCLSASVDVNDVQQRVKRKGGIILGVVCQFIVLPACGALVILCLGVDSVIGIALLVTTSSPGGSYSNWWCSIFNADLAMSVAMTAISTVVGIGMLPINLYVYSQLLYGVDVLSLDQWFAVVLSIAFILAALGGGMLTSWLMDNERAREIFNVCGNLAGVCLLVFSIFVSSFAGKSTSPIWAKPPHLYPMVALPIVLGMLISASFTSLPLLGLRKPERVAVVIEVCYQNVGLASAVILSVFSGKNAGDAVAIPLLYGLAEALLLGIFCVIAHYSAWTMANPKEVSLVKALATNYQTRAKHVDEETPLKP